MADQQLTQDQIGAIAQMYHDMADLIRKFIVAHAASLSDTQEDALEEQQDMCLQYSSEYIEKSLTLQQAELDASGQDIQNAIAQANQAIQNIQRADKALQIATAATVLGASLLTGDYDTVPDEIKGVWTAVKIDTRPGDDQDGADDASAANS